MLFQDTLSEKLFVKLQAEESVMLSLLLMKLVNSTMIFRLFINVKLYAYVLWPLAKRVQNWIVDQSTARDFTVLMHLIVSNVLSYKRNQSINWKVQKIFFCRKFTLCRNKQQKLIKSSFRIIRFIALKGTASQPKLAYYHLLHSELRFVSFS